MAISFPFTALDAPPDLYYLANGFPSAKLTVADLREILIKHGINEGRASRRADYVAAFEDKIYARREYIFRLKAHGIDTVGATLPGVTDHEDADHIMMSGALQVETEEEDEEPEIKKKTASAGRSLPSRRSTSPARSVSSKSFRSPGPRRASRARAPSAPKPDDFDLRDLVSGIQDIKSSMEGGFRDVNRQLANEKAERVEQFEQLSEAFKEMDGLEPEREYERGGSRRRKRGGVRTV